ncbi:hypothetical protein GF385_04365 [Candidatus Dependentiae bacterium]|nr:hypothetical protein [Candidatus Dependentiae bacterium]
MKKKLLFLFLFVITFLNSKVFVKRNNNKKFGNIKRKILFVAKKNSVNSFSQFYSKLIKHHKNIKENYYIWLENNSNYFNELILSWNAFRPKKGKYSFYVSVKYNNRWSGWQKIAEWADKYQKTFLNTKNTFVHTKHVRVEMQKNKKANGFRIKVLAQNGAKIKNLKSLFVSLADMNKFIFEKKDFNKATTIIKGVPKVSQWSVKHERAKDFCSPTSTAMVLGYYSKKRLFRGISNKLSGYIKKMAPKIHDDSYLDIYGAWPFNVAQAFDLSKGKLSCSVQRLNGMEQLYYFLRRRIPVAVSVRGYLKGGFKRYDNGHFVVVVGWDNKRKALLCIDPAFPTLRKMLRAYNFKDFIKAWGTSRNLTYILKP